MKKIVNSFVYILTVILLIAVPANALGKQMSYDELTKLMEQARVAMVSLDYDKAIRLYTKSVYALNNPYKQEAQEYLGLARERNGQLAHAKAEYLIYLENYPEGEGAVRVRKRLDALLNAFKKTEARSDDQVEKLKSEQWHHSGALIQYYLKEQEDEVVLGSITRDSILSTNLNFTSQLLNSDDKMKAHFQAVHQYDTELSETDDNRVNALYFEMNTKDDIFYMRAGRQKDRSSAVLGRYDGVDLAYKFADEYKAKFFTGIPFEINGTVVDRNDKYFYGTGLQYTPTGSDWEGSAFLLQQTADDLTDRQEVGVEYKYQTKATRIYSILDYSTQYSTVNYFMALLNLRFEDTSTLDFIADYRKTPFLTTTNAMQGQVGISSLADLLDTLTEDEIEQLSLDQTALYKSFTALYTTPFYYEELRLTTDVSVTNLEGTVVSPGVYSIADTGNEYSVSIGLIAENLFMDNDSNTINWRLSKLTDADVSLLSINSKLRIDRQLIVNPRFRYDARQFEDETIVKKLIPSVKIIYRQNRHLNFEMELEYEYKLTDPLGDSNIEESTTVIYAGYVYVF